MTGPLQAALNPKLIPRPSRGKRTRKKYKKERENEEEEQIELRKTPHPFLVCLFFLPMREKRKAETNKQKKDGYNRKIYKNVEERGKNRYRAARITAVPRRIIPKKLRW